MATLFRLFIVSTLLMFSWASVGSADKASEKILYEGEIIHKVLQGVILHMVVKHKKRVYHCRTPIALNPKKGKNVWLKCISVD